VVRRCYAKGLTTGEISAHFAEVYGASVSKETISRITDAMVTEMQDWAVRPLTRSTRRSHRCDRGEGPATVKSPTARSTPRSESAGRGEDILGLWAGSGGEGAKFWMSVLTDLRKPRRARRVLPGL